jgi:hypothetical protein
VSAAAHFDPQYAQARQELRDAMTTQTLAIRRRRIGDSLGMPDLTLSDRVDLLGFDGESAAVFDLLPLIHVAWADGKIQAAERALILQVLEVRGFEPGSKAMLTIEALLERRPSKEYFAESLRVLKEVLIARPSAGATVVSLCAQVAESAGGFLGVNRVSGRERKLIEEIANTLGERAQVEFQRSLG